MTVKIYIGSHFLAFKNHLIKTLSIELPEGAESISFKIFAEDEHTLSFHAIARPSGVTILKEQMAQGEEPSAQFLEQHSNSGRKELAGEFMQWQIEGEQAPKSSFPVCLVDSKGFDLDAFLSNPEFEGEKDVHNASEALLKLLTETPDIEAGQTQEDMLEGFSS